MIWPNPDPARPNPAQGWPKPDSANLDDLDSWHFGIPRILKNRNLNFQNPWTICFWHTYRIQLVQAHLGMFRPNVGKTRVWVEASSWNLVLIHAFVTKFCLSSLPKAGFLGAPKTYFQWILAHL